MTQNTPPSAVVRLRQTNEPVAFTAQRVRNLKPRAQRYEVRDSQTPGLLVRVQPSGAKSYYVKARCGSGRAAPVRSVRIGTTDEIALSDARAEALRLLAMLRRGTDPTAPDEVLTVGQLIEAHVASLQARGVVKHKEIASLLRRDLHPFRNLPAPKLERRHVVGLLDAMEARGVSPAYLRQRVRALLGWASNAGHVPHNVLAGYQRQKATRDERLQPRPWQRPKPTLVSAEEIRTFWAATELHEYPVWRDLLRFFLLTGQRRNETGHMLRGHVAGGVWNIPAENRKTGEALQVPLGPLSSALLEAQPRMANVDCYWPTPAGKPMPTPALVLKPIQGAMPAGFGFHALRRTYRTGLEELGVPERVAELMIGHVRPDLMARYSEAELWEQRVEAQNRWEAHVQEVLT